MVEHGDLLHYLNMKCMNNILLIYPKPSLDKNPRFGFSVQLLQLATILKTNKANVFYLDYSYKEYYAENLIHYININNIDTIITEIDTFALKRSENLNNALEILKLAKDNNVKTMAFGYSCIMDSDSILYADYVVKANPLIEIPKLIFESPNIPNISNYDTLPYPDRDLLLTNDFFAKNNSSTLIKTAEGCLNSCIFCQRRGWQNSYKKHSIDYVIKEFTYLKEKHYKNVWINDENFTFDIYRAKKILRELINNSLTNKMKISISSWSKIDKEFLDLFKKANGSIISMGIESANEKILEYYKKKIDLNKTKELIDYADSIGIYMVGNFIIGAPMESEETIEKTFSFIFDSKLDQVNIKILDYMIGSILYEKLNKKDKHHYFACAENKLCKFPLQDLINIKNNFLNKFYKMNQNRLKEKIIKFGEPYYQIKY